MNECGLDVNIRDRSTGRTPLHDAATYVCTSCGTNPAIVSLIEAGADVDIKDYRVTTPVRQIYILFKLQSALALYKLLILCFLCLLNDK